MFSQLLSLHEMQQNEHAGRMFKVRNMKLKDMLPVLADEGYGVSGCEGYGAFFYYYFSRKDADLT